MVVESAVPALGVAAAMEGGGEVKLFGSWASSYTHRVQLALKLKGIEFEYIEEDLANKSPELLLHNPVYKKVPVLLHGGRPLAESLVILEYLGDAWPDNHRAILPSDPYERAVARFWCHFVDDKLGPSVGAVFGSSGDEQKAAATEVHENLKLVEAELRDGAFKGRRFFNGEKIGLLDIVLGCGSYWLSVFEEVAEVKLVDQESYPLFHAWLRDFEEQEEVKEIIPPTEKLLDYARAVRQLMLSLKGGESGDGSGGSSSDDSGNGSP